MAYVNSFKDCWLKIIPLLLLLFSRSKFHTWALHLYYSLLLPSPLISPSPSQINNLLKIIIIYMHTCKYSLLSLLSFVQYPGVTIWDWTTYIRVLLWRQLIIPLLEAIDPFYLIQGWDHVEFPLSPLACQLVSSFFWFSLGNTVVDSSGVHFTCHVLGSQSTKKFSEPLAFIIFLPLKIIWIFLNNPIIKW